MAVTSENTVKNDVEPQRIETSASSQLGSVVGFCAILGIGFLLAGWEPLVWQKIVKELVMPVGFCWLLLSATLLLRWWSPTAHWGNWLLGGCWFTLTLLGSSFVGDRLIGSLENQFIDQRPLQMDRFDVLIVLGGGTSTTKSGRPQFGRGGDRVAVAAQMFHANKVDKIIVTGMNITEFVGVRSGPADQASDLLVSLGVDPSRIEKVGGRITLEEMRELSKILPQDQRIGLVTSAWHLPRALRRAEAAGLELVPVPSDFLTGPKQHSILDHIPKWEGLQHSTLAVHEYLGMAVGR